MTISIFINGKQSKIQTGLSVSRMLSEYHFDPGKVAVAINKKFVPRNNYDQHVVLENDHIDIVAPIQGG